jgi:DNA-binding response OmpR family regulator
MIMSIEVLLVDEDTDVLSIVQTFLQQEEDLEVTGEEDPETALEMALTGGYDIVVSDYKMPRLNGVELCSEIRSEDDQLPFVLFSAREIDDIQAVADDAGVTSIVQKGTGTEQYGELATKIRASA